MNLLEIKNLTKEFDGLVAADDISISIESGSIVALIGPNGAGKTTVFNIITGLLRPTCGEIYFKNKRITNLSTYQIAQLGISRTFQNIRLFPQMSIMDNLLLATKYETGERLLSAFLRPKTMLNEEKRNIEKVHQKLNYLLFSTFERFNKDKYAQELSCGQRKLLELTRALLTNPDLFLLDEPTAGVFPELKQKILDIIKELKEKGKTVIFIEHDMKVVSGIADKIIVLNYGRKIVEGTERNNKR